MIFSDFTWHVVDQCMEGHFSFCCCCCCNIRKFAAFSSVFPCVPLCTPEYGCILWFSMKVVTNRRTNSPVDKQPKRRCLDKQLYWFLFMSCPLSVQFSLKNIWHVFNFLYLLKSMKFYVIPVFVLFFASSFGWGLSFSFSQLLNLEIKIKKVFNFPSFHFMSSSLPVHFGETI